MALCNMLRSNVCRLHSINEACKHPALATGVEQNFCFRNFETDEIRLTWQKICDLCLKTERQQKEKKLGLAKVETRVNFNQSQRDWNDAVSFYCRNFNSEYLLTLRPSQLKTNKV